MDRGVVRKLLWEEPEPRTLAQGPGVPISKATNSETDGEVSE